VIPWSAPVYTDYLYPLAVLPADVMGAGRAVQVASVNAGILLLFAIGGTGVVGAALAGYCSDNKYALLGGLRAASQMVSYEVTLGLSLVGCFMVYQTLLLEDMVQWQVNNHLWGVFMQPHMCILFMAAAIAETKRIPFDVPEGESELAAGYFTEYSGMKFGMFMMGEYIEMVVLSAVVVVMFFGGYDFPFLFADGFRLSFSIGDTTLFDVAGARLPLPHLAMVVASVLIFILKIVVLCWFQLMIRWSLPRFRYDQIMTLCWRYMLPISIVNVFLTGMFILGKQYLLGE
jgi:NADH-quinone oxidoreductase subunit H